MQARRLRFAAVKEVEWEPIDIPSTPDAHRRLRSEGLIDLVIRPEDAPAIYDELVDSPQRFLGILIDWR